MVHDPVKSGTVGVRLSFSGDNVLLCVNHEERAVLSPDDVIRTIRSLEHFLAATKLRRTQLKPKETNDEH